MSTPKRSAAAKHSPSEDVFKGFGKSRGGFTGTAKGSGRTWNDNEHRPTSGTPATRKEARRGPSRLVVVDLDTPKDGTAGPTGLDTLAALAVQHGAGIDVTYTVTTGRGGTHLYYRHPENGPALRNTAGTLGPMVDTRAHGGYVVAAGSTVAGRPYTVDLDSDPAPLPAWLAELLAPAPLPPQRPVVVDLGTGRAGGYVRAAIAREVDRVTTAPAGERNRALYIAAVALGQLVAGDALGEDDAQSVLEQAGVMAGLRTAEAYRTVRSGLTAGAHRPRKVAA